MRYFLLILSLCFSAAAYAQGVATFAYQRGEITILRSKPAPDPALPWQSENAMQPTALTLAVDIRPSDSLYRQQGWMSLSTLGANSGLLFIFDKPQTAHITKMDYLEPIDVVWIDDTGSITSIAPSLALNTQQEPLADPKPSKAILFLAGGTAETQHIKPSDKIIGSEFFTAATKILSGE